MKGSNLWGGVIDYLLLTIDYWQAARRHRVRRLGGVVTGRFAVAIVVASIVGLVGSSTAMALSGSGTEGDPWLIQSLADFDEFAADANYWDDYTRLETDVNLAGRVYGRAVIAPDSDGSNYAFDDIEFAGSFDGCGYNISELTIDATGTSNDYLGLFGQIANGGSVKNLTMTEVTIRAGLNSGAVGGLAGSNGPIYEVEDGGLVQNCSTEGAITGTSFLMAGGLVGMNFGHIDGCYSTASIAADGTFSGELTPAFGGLVGMNASSISSCYAVSEIANDYGVSGAMVGINTTSAVIANSYWDIETTGEPNMCGNPEDPNCDNSYGKTTSQLQQQSTFTGWDFIGVWNIGENQTYPYLRTVPAGDINKDKTVNFLDVAILGEKWMKEE